MLLDMVQHEAAVPSAATIANVMLVRVNRDAEDRQEILADERRMRDGYVMTFAYHRAVVEYENLCSVSCVLVFRVPIPAMSRVLQVLRLFKVETREEGSFRGWADVDKLHLPPTSRFDPYTPLTSIGMNARSIPTAPAGFTPD
jgi:hypothetical protein